MEYIKEPMAARTCVAVKELPFGALVSTSLHWWFLLMQAGRDGGHGPFVKRLKGFSEVAIRQRDGWHLMAHWPCPGMWSKLGIHEDTQAIEDHLTMAYKHTILLEALCATMSTSSLSSWFACHVLDT